MNNAFSCAFGGSAARVDVSPSDGETATIDPNGDLLELVCGEGRVGCHAEHFSLCRKQRRFCKFSIKSGESDLDDAVIV